MFGNTKTIVSIDLKGVIASGARAQLNNDALSSIFLKLEKIKCDAISININSPGGSPVQSSLIGNKIRSIASKKKVKVYAFVEDVAASGGYWLACSADKIYADDNSILGSIGVISGGFGFTGLIKKLGIERRIFTAGQNKSFLDPFSPVNKIDLEKLKKIQRNIHSNFINWVKSNRGKRIKPSNEKEIFSGSFWLSQEAKNLGLIDGIGSETETLKLIFGEKVKIKKIKQAKSLKQKLGLGIKSDYVDTVFNKLKEEHLFSKYGL
ncbi:MAG: S49 family peptidase [Alphaproteobacteria bacterium]|jgi:signal peptide peptidase SppA|nr:S49 family peptidase [Alphaproteobacteria bacterium]|tara:strand:+ start:2893 stop:3687 length:795 start_codon:yes stop_codon:yes gene_type:complete